MLEVLQKERLEVGTEVIRIVDGKEKRLETKMETYILPDDIVIIPESFSRFCTRFSKMTKTIDSDEYGQAESEEYCSSCRASTGLSPKDWVNRKLCSPSGWSFSYLGI